jgi:hypothetical protein
VTVQLLSGPDLGGGFLYQLSFDPEGDRATFTYHAQDGGSDAGGPPPGPLDVFHFVHPSSPCMFGGPRCWHRRFLLPLSEAPRVRQAYNRLRFVMEVMAAQAFSDAPVAVDAGTREVVDRLAGPLEREGVDWYIGGSVAAWLQGAPVRPHDLDLGTTRAGVDRLGALLAEYLIEPVAPTEGPEGAITRAARAFVGTFKEGVRAEWGVPLEPRSPLPLEEWSGHPGVARVETVRFHGHEVRVTRPEYMLVRAAEKGRETTAAALATWLRPRGPDRELLETLLGRSRLPRTARERLVTALFA